MRNIWLVDGHLLATRLYFADKASFVPNFCYFLDGIYRRATRESPSAQLVTIWDAGAPSWRADGTRRTKGVGQTGYKTGRPPQEMGLREGIQVLQRDFFWSRGWLSRIAPRGLEADDVLAKLATKYSHGKYRLAEDQDTPPATVVSGDKDLLQVVSLGCRVYDPFQYPVLAEEQPDAAGVNLKRSSSGKRLSNSLNGKRRAASSPEGRSTAQSDEAAEPDPDQSSKDTTSSTSLFSEPPAPGINVHTASYTTAPEESYYRGVFMTKEMIERKWQVPHDRIGEYLAIHGDAVDSIRGVPGVGKLTVGKLLSHPLARGLSLPELIRNESLLSKCGLKPRYIKLLRAGYEDALHAFELVRLPPPRNPATAGPLDEVYSWDLHRECEEAFQRRDNAKYHEFCQRWDVNLLAFRSDREFIPPGWMRRRSRISNISSSSSDWNSEAKKRMKASNGAGATSHTSQGDEWATDISGGHADDKSAFSALWNEVQENSKSFNFGENFALDAHRAESSGVGTASEQPSWSEQVRIEHEAAEARRRRDEHQFASEVVLVVGNNSPGPFGSVFSDFVSSDEAWEAQVMEDEERLEMLEVGAIWPPVEVREAVAKERCAVTEERRGDQEEAVPNRLRQSKSAKT
ncbi:unnamed protein product [Amoebophrya sp. A25]|nr:unnamed protein product [Amoebophrya sp. A25]|eukprot:GSA25T00005698001.1